MLVPRLEYAPDDETYQLLTANVLGLIQSLLKAHDDRMVQDSFVLSLLTQLRRHSVLKSLRVSIPETKLQELRSAPLCQSTAQQALDTSYSDGKLFFGKEHVLAEAKKLRADNQGEVNQTAIFCHVLGSPD